MGEAVVGDFNADGVTDVIIPTAEGYYGLVLDKSIGFALYPVAVLVLVGTLGAFAFLEHVMIDSSKLINLPLRNPTHDQKEEGTNGAQACRRAPRKDLSPALRSAFVCV